MRAFIFALYLSSTFWGLVTFTPVAFGSSAHLSYLDLSGEQFFSQAADPEVESTFSHFGFGLQQRWLSVINDWDLGVEAEGQLALDSSQQHYLAVPEFYMLWVDRSGAEPSGLRLALGRRRHSWSVLDDEWKLGLWQPVARWDEIERRTQGFVGVFVDGKIERFSGVLLLSPIFIPDQGPQSQLQNGKFSSGSRWFRPPPRHLIPLGDEETEIQYEVAMPPLASLLTQFSLAGQLKWQGSQGYWLSLNLADKPLNQIQLPYDGALDISARSDYGLARVVVHPQVFRHRLVGAELGYGTNESQLWASVTREWIQSQALPESWLFSPPEGGYYPGVGFRQNWAFWGWPGVETSVSYLGFWADPPLSRLSQEEINRGKSERHPFQEALAWGGSSTWSWAENQSFSLGFQHIYSFSEQGSLLSVSLKAQTQARLFWSLGLDLLGTGSQPQPGEGGLISQHRHNDRLRAGVTYVF